MSDKIRVSKFDEKYVGEDCVQIMTPFLDTMTLVNNNDILFHSRSHDDIEINSYLNDERRIQFPYHEIPAHRENDVEGMSVFCANQLYDFGKNYVLIRNGVVRECVAIKNNDGTFLFEKTLKTINKSVNHMSNGKMNNLFSELLSCSEGEKAYAIDINGNFIRAVSDDERHNNMLEFISYLEEKGIKYKYDGHSLEWFGKVDKDRIPNTSIPFNKPIFIVKLNGENIDIKLFEATYIENNFVKVAVSNIPVKPISLDVISILLNEDAEIIKEPIFQKKEKQYRKSFWRNRH